MKISATLAQNIIDGLASVLQQQLNVFDENGIIIASTSPERIGNFHDGMLSHSIRNEICA